MRYRRSYYNRNPDKVPNHAGLFLEDLDERRLWWRDLLPLRRIGQLWDFFQKQPADVRLAGHELIESLMDDPMERDSELYQTYRGRLHRNYRLDERITWQLVVVARKRVEKATNEVRAGLRLSAGLVPLKVVHDQLFLLHEGWTHTKPHDDREEKAGYRGGQRAARWR